MAGSIQMKASRLLPLGLSSILLSALPGAAHPQQAAAPDTMDGVRKVVQILTDYYEPFDGDLGGFGMHRGSLMTDGPTSRCDGGAGSMCFADDPDRGPCPVDASCHPPPEFLLEGLFETAMKNPGSGYVLGQAVFALTKYGLSTRAMILVDQCQAQDWWCSMLQGYVLHAQNHFQEAEDAFLKGLSGAPLPKICSWGDGTLLLGRWDPVSAQQTLEPGLLPDAERETSDWPCLDRLDASALIWWLADPLYSQDGNQRWVEHIARSLTAQFQEELWEARRMPSDSFRWLPVQQSLRRRRGTWDSYQKPYQSGYALWTSEKAAPYHFVPEVSLEDLLPDPGGYPGTSPSAEAAGEPALAEKASRGLPDARWHLLGDTWDEGMSLALGPFLPIPVQLARFRRGDSLNLAAAGDLGNSPLGGNAAATANFVLTDSPGAIPLHLSTPVTRTQVLFLAKVPAKAYVAGFEVLGGEAIGWHREMVFPLRPTGPELSDLLLYRPSPRIDADSLIAAVALMRGSNTVYQDSPVGIYWESYDVPGDQTLELELSLKGESGGVVQTITGLIPGLGQEQRAPVRWTEPGTAGTNPGSLVLNLRGLNPGTYTVTLKVGWPGQVPLERNKEIRVLEAPTEVGTPR
jgi:hypothetical protein